MKLIVNTDSVCVALQNCKSSQSVVYTSVTLSTVDSDGFTTIIVTGSLTSSRGMASAAAVMGNERKIYTYTHD